MSWRTARELRIKPTMPLAWVANRLQTGYRGHTGRLVQQRARCLRPTRSGERLLGVW
jgi:hypothetical protein